jgi:hypothetical protein
LRDALEFARSGDTLIVSKLDRLARSTKQVRPSRSCRDARHQAVVIDSVEKFFEIKVNDDAIARGNVWLRYGVVLLGSNRSPEDADMADALDQLGTR